MLSELYSAQFSSGDFACCKIFVEKFCGKKEKHYFTKVFSVIIAAFFFRKPLNLTSIAYVEFHQRPID